MTSRSLDTGHANERTTLAWQRTALSIMAGAAIMARLTWETLGMVAGLLLAAALGLGLLVLVSGQIRYESNGASTPHNSACAGRAGAALAAATAIVGLVELIALSTGP